MVCLRYDDNQTALSQIGSNLKEFIPTHMVRTQSSSEWRKSITSAYNTNKGAMTAADAKSKFLEIIYQWPTFGSTFFEVKQTTESSYPEIVTIAINKNGVNIIHPQTKVGF